MNWYRKIKLADDMRDPSWEDIERYGPKGEEFADGLEPDMSAYKLEENRRYMTPILRRTPFVQNYSWSAPTKDAIEKIKKFVAGGRVVEIGSGWGLWARLMKDVGINIVATDVLQRDITQEHLNKNFDISKDDMLFTEVERINHQKAMEKYNNYDVLMMSWPPYDNPLANETLLAFRGNKIIFIGEGQYGCTGDDSFFCNLYEKFEEAGRVDIPQWYGLHDDLSFWIRK